MAIPLRFKPLPVDPKRELQRQLAAAPTEHAEALLVLWNLLETAHQKGILDLVDGMISAKDHDRRHDRALCEYAGGHRGDSQSAGRE